MKLVIQIPCLNEEHTLPLVLRDIPKKIDGIDSIEILVIDDKSSDKTVEVARQHGVKHFVFHRRWMGLAHAFRGGVDYALAHGADIIVNTDGDNQYPQARIPDLIKPILEGQADIVIGDRQTSTIAHFSPIKKKLQQLGSWLVNKAAGTEIPDAVSGFRAYSRHAAMRLNVVTEFSYCTETIIQAGQKRLAIAHLPIKTNAKTRESRLFKNMGQHVYKSAKTIFRSYLMGKPFKVFVATGGIIFLLGTLPFIRFAILAIVEGAFVGGHIQSILLGSVLLIIGFLVMVLGVMADLIAINRKLLEDALTRLRELEYGEPTADRKRSEK